MGNYISLGCNESIMKRGDDTFIQTILEILKCENPLTLNELKDKIGVNAEEESNFLEALKKLEADGIVLRNGKIKRIKNGLIVSSEFKLKVN